MSEAEQHLSQSGIEYKVEERESMGQYLTAGVGVRFTFSDDGLFLRALSYGIAAY